VGDGAAQVEATGADQLQHDADGGAGEAVGAQQLELFADELHGWQHGDRVGAEAGNDGASADPQHLHGAGDGVGEADELGGDVHSSSVGGGEDRLGGGLIVGVDGDVGAEGVGAGALFGAGVDGDDRVGAE
jgi:hypothetical protein